VPATVLAAAVVAVLAASIALSASVVAALTRAVVLSAPVLADVGGNGAIGLAGLGDAGKHGDGAAKRETGNEDSNQLGHGVLHSYGQTAEEGGHLSPVRATFA
jgi:opacity protein-like surface antigen